MSGTFTPTPGLVLIGRAPGDVGPHWWTIAGRWEVRGLSVFVGTETVSIGDLIARGDLDPQTAQVVPVELLPDLLRHLGRCRS